MVGDKPLKSGDVLIAHSLAKHEGKVMFYPGDTFVVLTVIHDEPGDTWSSEFHMLSANGPIHWSRGWSHWSKFLKNESLGDL